MGDVFERVAALSAEKRAQLLRHLQEQRTSAHASPDQYDVAILGGGLAGLTLALQLKKARPSIKVLVIEKQAHPVPEAAHKVGESTVEIAAHYLRDILDLQEHLQTHQLRKFGLRMFFSYDDNQDITRRVELGSTVFPPLATYQLDRGRLENALGQELKRQEIFLDGCKVSQVELLPQQNAHRLHIVKDEQEKEITARWVVDTTGRSSLLKRQLDLATKGGHHANAVWFRINHPIDINNWSDDPAWRSRITQGDRSISTNHLMGPGYWVWMIRLASGSISIGIVTAANAHPFEEINRFERALAWLHTHEPQCAAAIEQHLDKVQDFRVMKDYSYSCKQSFSSERWALTGEAAIALDPLYSPGSDLIAIGNGLTADLIMRDLNGEDIHSRAVVHDKLFLNLTTIWLAIYEQQYVLMDNAQIMVAKIIWDTAFYWAVFGLLYFHDAFTTLAETPGVATSLTQVAVLSNRIQAFFREWHAIADPVASDTFVDLYTPFEFMQNLHKGMAADLSRGELDAQFAANVHLFELLAGQMVSTVIDEYGNQFQNELVFRQVQRWQADPYLAKLLALYRREGRAAAINDAWIRLGQQSQVQVEMTR